jgi:hypothetical protein
MKKIAVIMICLFVLLMSGCASTRAVDQKYLPLTTMSERPWYAAFLGGTGTITTIGDTVYVSTLKRWDDKKERYPRRYDAVMLHEMTHSLRQFSSGTAEWISSYLSSKDFRWKEEQLGWYIELRKYKQYGFRINVEAVAKTLSEYSPSLTDYDTALQWTKDVVSGKWKPEAGELLPH